MPTSIVVVTASVTTVETPRPDGFVAILGA